MDSENLMEAIFSRIKNNDPSLTRIDVNNHNIDGADVAKLAEALKTNTVITMVFLVSNNLGDAGAAQLAEALAVNTQITSINLTHNSIGDIGAAKLAEALKINKQITTFDLAWNQIGDIGAAKLAEALKINRQITSINLAWNQINDAGAKKLAEILHKNNTLILMYHRCNNISYANSQKIRTLLERNKNIYKITEAIREIDNEETIQLPPEKYQARITQKIKNIEEEIHKLSNLYSNYGELERLKETWILKLIELGRVDIKKQIHLICSLKINLGYSQQFLEELIMHGYGQAVKKKRDYKKIIRLCLSLSNFDDFESLLIDAATAYFGLSKKEFSTNLAKAELKVDFNASEKKLFLQIQKKVLESNPFNKDKPTFQTKLSWFNDNKQNRSKAKKNPQIGMF